jgi:hypothetical protein
MMACVIQPMPANARQLFECPAMVGLLVPCLGRARFDDAPAVRSELRKGRLVGASDEAAARAEV